MVYQKHGFLNNLIMTDHFPPMIILVGLLIFITVPIAQEISTEPKKHITDVTIGVHDVEKCHSKK